MLKSLRKGFSTFKTTEFLPVIDLNSFLSSPSESNELCSQVADSLYKSGILLIKDCRANFSNNERFLSLFEQYYASRSEMRKNNKPIEEMFPKNGYKTGVTPDYIEKPRDNLEFRNSLLPKYKPLTALPPEKDPKWRYLWRIGEREPGTKFSQMEPERVPPKDFPEFTEVVDIWGNTMLQSVHTVAQMLEQGLQLPKNSFTHLLKNGNTVVGPTGSDLGVYKKNTVFAGMHYDISFLTIHGKSRYPGLYIWLRNGEKMRVVVPENCFLLQAGRELEYLTGGYIKAGFHEVVYDELTEKAVEKAKKEARSLWRVSSTMFSHIKSNAILEPLEKFSNETSRMIYPKTTGEEYTIKEFSYINLIEL